MTAFRVVFPGPKPVLGMLHLGGDDAAARLSGAIDEARIMAGEGVDGLLVENYFGDAADVERALDRLIGLDFGPKIGINLLHDDAGAFALATRYPVSFIQIDSVAGHLPQSDDEDFACRLAGWRASVPATTVLGGVRFKYQPVLSGRTEAADVEFAVARCDALVVTSEATGQPTDLAKVERFRRRAGDTPLLIGAGMTEHNASDQLHLADGAIVGSWLKEGHRDRGKMAPAHVASFMAAVRRAREMRMT